MNSTTPFLHAPEKQVFTKPLHVLVIGAGSRGTAYAESALQATNSVIAGVCEPIAYKRREFGRKFIWGDGEAGPRQAFVDWRAWVLYETERREREERGEVGVERGVDAVFVCVLDEMHEEVVCGIAHLRVHVCVEKPLSTRLESCVRIYRALRGGGSEAERKSTSKSKSGGVRRDPVFAVCHVLRYSPHNMLLRHLVVDEKVIGDVLSMEHVEPVGWWHFSHSYVRGNWRKESTSAPSLLTKSCHDIDFLMWMLCSPPSSASSATQPHLPSFITSTGSRTFFRRERKPKAAGNATNCLSCPHELECSYSAKKIYLDRHLSKGDTGWPVKIVNPEIEDIFKTRGKKAARDELLKSLAEDYTPSRPVSEVESRPWFGRCVWDADNDVCDDQHVTITWEDSASSSNHAFNGARAAKTASFHMTAFTQSICQRRGRIYGTRGEIEYDSTHIRVYDSATEHTTVHTPHAAGGGHGGGDEGLVRQFLMAVDAVESGGVEAGVAQRRFLGCDLEEVVRSHAVVFAAEEARVERKVVDWRKWWGERVEGT